MVTLLRVGKNVWLMITTVAGFMVRFGGWGVREWSRKGQIDVVGSGEGWRMRRGVCMWERRKEESGRCWWRAVGGMGIGSWWRGVEGMAQRSSGGWRGLRMVD